MRVIENLVTTLRGTAIFSTEVPLASLCIFAKQGPLFALGREARDSRQTKKGMRL